MKPIAVLLGPGTNCYEESVYAIEQAGFPAEVVILNDIANGHENLLERPAIFLPGGFSFGDHYGSGRIMGLILKEILQAFAALDRPILGVCNGFQIQMEAGLFEGEDGSSGGALVPNLSGRFESRWIELWTYAASIWTEDYGGRILRMPVAHGEGRWLKPEQDPMHLKPTFSYSKDGKITEEYWANPNGSPLGITGLANGLVMGMMPHPERAVREAQGSIDGRLIFDSFVKLTKAA